MATLTIFALCALNHIIEGQCVKGKQQSRRDTDWSIGWLLGCYPSPLPLWLGTTTAMFYGLLSLTVPFRPLRLWANIWLEAGGSGGFCPNSTTWALKRFYFVQKWIVYRSISFNTRKTNLNLVKKYDPSKGPSISDSVKISVKDLVRRYVFVVFFSFRYLDETHKSDNKLHMTET